MGLLSNLEHRLDRIVNGSFSKAFKSQVDPVELAAALQQELDLQATLTAGRTVTPNVFVIDLSTADFKRLQPYLPNLTAELAEVAKAHIVNQRYAVLGRLSIGFTHDSSLETGTLRIRSEATANVAGPAAQVDPRLAPQVPAAVTAPSRTATLTTVDGRTYTLTKPVTVIGRGEQADVPLTDASASRAHCEVVLGSEILLRDLGSTNGTMVDGVPAHEVALRNGSIIRIGDTTLTYRSA